MKTVTEPVQKNAHPARRTKDELDRLVVFDRLEVGPVRVERNRLKAPYTVLKDGRVLQSMDLIYSYEEPVFDPKEPDSQNLANMVAAQLALNYGLFFKEIVFRGLFDSADQRFIKDMAENTAREIYVKKFLEPNPFLIGDAATLPVIRKESYLTSRLLFPDAGTAEANWKPWESERGRHAVLSSGGKDSLLSYGLINDAGGEAHSIFINESGRHWFTALNAYRYFARHIPHTARVWVNSDRVFAGMTRLFPFIRKDFATIRSDDYPIRLWTVAIFLFGALPILRTRKISRLLIGDEYDTSFRLNFSGVTHYKGYYDQSIWFDSALTRYFARKSWNVHQLSILRNLSELLIEKILYERYPQLQAQQMSCHATHTEGKRVKPCGKCEKCHRVVGMLLAIDADPGPCGYTGEQIEDVKKGIGSRGLHQESAGVEHLFYMLARKNLVPFPGEILRKLKSHPEILKVRIDPEKAPFAAIPPELREPLYRILLPYAWGAAQKTGRTWQDMDLLDHPEVKGIKSPEKEVL